MSSSDHSIRYRYKFAFCDYMQKASMAQINTCHQVSCFCRLIDLYLEVRGPGRAPPPPKCNNVHGTLVTCACPSVVDYVLSSSH